MIKISSEIVRKQHNFWNHIHFHPTDAIEDEWGQRYLGEVSDAKVANTVRMYAMLEDIVTCDADGELCYDFTENDVRMDYMISKGFNLLVSLNFIPPCISESYDRNNTETRVGSRYKGKFLCTIPPKDWGLWETVCYEYIKHIVERYSLERVKNWYLQCYNEPDVAAYFYAPLGKTPEALKLRCEQYCHMYEAFQKAAIRVSPSLKIGGPAASWERVFETWLAYVKEHNLKADFACGHAYGTRPSDINNGIRDINASHNVKKIKSYLSLIDKYIPGLELVIDEWGASCSGFKNLTDAPRLVFRENEIYSALYGQLISRVVKENLPVSKLLICLSGSHQPHQLPGKFVEFNGFRSFFSENFVTKPIFNAYALGAKLLGGIVEAEFDCENTDITATSDGENYAVMIAYADEHYTEELKPLCETLSLPLKGKYRITTWIIDRDHVNPYRMWQKENMPAHPDECELERLRAEGKLRPFEICEFEADGELSLELSLGCNGLALIEAEKL